MMSVVLHKTLLHFSSILPFEKSCPQSCFRLSSAILPLCICTYFPSPHLSRRILRFVSPLPFLPFRESYLIYSQSCRRLPRKQIGSLCLNCHPMDHYYLDNEVSFSAVSASTVEKLSCTALSRHCKSRVQAPITGSLPMGRAGVGRQRSCLMYHRELNYAASLSEQAVPTFQCMEWP